MGFSNDSVSFHRRERIHKHIDDNRTLSQRDHTNPKLSSLLNITETCVIYHAPRSYIQFILSFLLKTYACFNQWSYQSGFSSRRKLRLVFVVRLEYFHDWRENLPSNFYFFSAKRCKKEKTVWKCLQEFPLGGRCKNRRTKLMRMAIIVKNNQNLKMTKEKCFETQQIGFSHRSRGCSAFSRKTVGKFVAHFLFPSGSATT